MFSYSTSEIHDSLEKAVQTLIWTGILKIVYWKSSNETYIENVISGPVLKSLYCIQDKNERPGGDFQSKLLTETSASALQLIATKNTLEEQVE